MKFIIETEQLVNTTYSLEADDEDDARFRFRSGEADEVDQYIAEELICDVYMD